MVDKSKVAMIVIAGGFAVFGIKLIAYLVSDSVALLSDALESIINIVASIMMYASIRYAARPPDEDHEFGHKKAENLSSLVEGLLIIIAALFIIETGISRMLSDSTELQSLDIALLISLSATGLNAAMAGFMWYESRRNGSLALEGDAKHLFSDVLSSGAIVVGLFVVLITKWYILDSIMAIFVAILITKMGIDVMRKSSTDLLDHSCPDIEARVRDVLDHRNGYIEYHDLKTRKSGDTVFVMFHLCIDGKATVKESHELTEKLEHDLESAIPGIDVMIHVESEDQLCKARTEEEEAHLNYRARSAERERGPKE